MNWRLGLFRLWIVGSALFVLAVAFSTYVSAQPNKELYELQERCGKRAAEVFQRNRNKTINNGGTRIIFNYRNHYNVRLNKCFYLQSMAAVTVEADGKSTHFNFMQLFDLNENSEYGRFLHDTLWDQLYRAPQQPKCEVLGEACRSETEWWQLLKPFMED